MSIGTILLIILVIALLGALVASEVAPSDEPAITAGAGGLGLVLVVVLIFFWVLDSARSEE